MPEGVVEQDGTFAGGRRHGLRLAGTRRQPSIECSERRFAPPDGRGRHHRRRGRHQRHFQCSRRILDAGGIGVLAGDGQLLNPRLEKIVEASYRYALTPSTRLTVVYQFVSNPAFNDDRGPVNAFAGRFHWQL